jgi:curved DNA-binding protein CbpA
MWKWLRRRKSLKDYYAILGVSPGASQKAVQKAFWAASQVLHPDVNSNPEDTEKFKEIVEAYQALKKPDSRDEYDAKVISDYCQTILGGSFGDNEAVEERKETYLDRIFKTGG